MDRKGEEAQVSREGSEAVQAQCSVKDAPGMEPWFPLSLQMCVGHCVL